MTTKKKTTTKDYDMDADIFEILDRVRRIETMLFKLAMALNVNPRTGGPITHDPEKPS